MKRKKGIILGVTLMMFLTIAVLGTTIMAIVMSKARQTNDLEKRTQAYFFARSGAEIARQYSSKADLADKIHILYGNLPGATRMPAFPSRSRTTRANGRPVSAKNWKPSENKTVWPTKRS